MNKYFRKSGVIALSVFLSFFVLISGFAFGGESAYIEGENASQTEYGFSETGSALPQTPQAVPAKPDVGALNAGDSQQIKAMAGGASISGTVTDAEGDPFEDVLVYLYEFIEDYGYSIYCEVADSVYTDEYGEYAFFDIAPGTYYLWFIPPGDTNYCGGYYDSSGTLVHEQWGESFEVTGDEVFPGIDVQMEFGASVSGKVTGAAGVALEDVEVSLGVKKVDDYGWGEYVWYRWGDYTYTGSDGEFEFQGIMPGTYYLKFELWGSDYTTGYYGGAGAALVFTEPGIPIELTSGTELSNLNVQMALGASISGKITGKGGVALNEAYVTAYNGDLNYLCYTETDSSGNYTLRGLPPGDVYLSADQYFSSVAYMTTYFGDGTTWPGNAIPVAAGVNYTGKNIKLAEAATIKGKLTGPDGKAVAGLTVLAEQIVPGGYIGNSAVSDANGNYEFSYLSPGTYTLHFYKYWPDANKNSRFYDQYLGGANTLEKATKFSVSAGSTISKNFQLKAGDTITGKAVDEKGDGAEGVAVRLFRSEYSIMETETDETGAYTFYGVQDGGYQVFFTAGENRGFIDAWYNGSEYGAPEKASAGSVSVVKNKQTNLVNTKLREGWAIKFNAYPDYGTVDSFWVYKKDGDGKFKQFGYFRRAGWGAGYSGIDGLAEGEYKIAFVPYLSAISYYVSGGALTGKLEDASVITVGPDQALTMPSAETFISFYSGGGSISGKNFAFGNASEISNKYYQVAAWRLEGSEAIPAAVYTGAFVTPESDGFSDVYSFGGLPDGDYLVTSSIVSYNQTKGGGAFVSGSAITGGAIVYYTDEDDSGTGLAGADGGALIDPFATTFDYEKATLVTIDSGSDAEDIDFIYAFSALTISFDSRGGSNVANVSRKFGDPYGTLPVPNAAGRVFLGWYTEPTGGVKIEPTTIVSGSVKLYAQWEVAVTWSAGAGAVFTEGPGPSLVLKYKYGIDEWYVPEPSRAGYTFDGWYTTAKFAQKIGFEDGDKMEVGKATTYYAKWVPNTYKVTLKTQKTGAAFTLPYGTVVSETVVWATYDKAYGALPVPKMDGWTFGGWFTSDNDGATLKTKVVNSTKHTSAGNLTLYALWTSKPIKVTLNANGGKINNKASFVQDTPVTDDTSAMYILPAKGDSGAPERNGHEFMSWHYDKACTSAEVHAASQFGDVNGNMKNHTLYAKWAGLPYDFDLDPNIPAGYTGSLDIFDDSTGTPMAASTYTMTYGQKWDAGTMPYAVPSATMKAAGLIFQGWALTPTGKVVDGTNWAPAKTDNLKLYARYANTFTINYEAFSAKNPAGKAFKWDAASLGNLTAAKRPGYVFGGWFADAGLTQKVEPTDTPATLFGKTSLPGSGITDLKRGTKDIVLYAKWIPVEYVVTYDFNGGINEPGDGNTYTKVTAGGVGHDTLHKDITSGWSDGFAARPEPVRTGYLFLGWGASKTGGKIVDLDTTPVTKKVTLYAQWADQYKNITLNANGGKMGGASTDTYVVEYGDGYARLSETLPTPTKDKFAFTGWYTKKAGGDKITDASIVDFVGKTITLFAQWTATPKTVKFDLNGGKFTGDIGGTAYDGVTKIPDSKLEWGGKYGTLPAPTPPIHEPTLYFAGWYTAKTGGTLITSSTDLTFTAASQTLYAQWSTTP